MRAACSSGNAAPVRAPRARAARGVRHRRLRADADDAPLRRQAARREAEPGPARVAVHPRRHGLLLSRLVFITQRVDRADPVLGATIAKIEALARRVDAVDVIAQHAAPTDLPQNVYVRTFGASIRPLRAVAFERALAQTLKPRPLGVVAHMIPLYVVLAAPLVRPRRIPLVLWITHWKASRLLRLSGPLSHPVRSFQP